MDGNPKQAVAEKIRSSSSVLVSVSKNPSVDQLASALGLSLMLDKLGKHTTTVFSGDMPNTMQFLEPEKTFDKTVDGLRDFIISLDKEKADKLRYKVEDNVVKIFITPYKTKLTSDDLNFSQGDYNVDLVIALGVHNREDMDEAITSHGRILHDAAIVTINAGGKGSNLGTVDWTDENASSLSEMLVSISEALEGGILDKQMSTAFLTAIVASTDRFKNDKTSPKVMTMAAQLMAAGANQQQIAQNLQIEEPKKSETSQPKNKEESKQEKPSDKDAKSDESFEIDRSDEQRSKKNKKQDTSEPETKLPEVSDDDTLNEIEQSVDSPHLQGSKPQSGDVEDPAIKELEDELQDEDAGDDTLAKLERELQGSDSNVAPNELQDSPQISRPRSIGPVKSIDNSAQDSSEKPSMGGTFNATAEEAHDEDERRNKGGSSTTLSHSAPGSKAPDVDPSFHAMKVAEEAASANDLQQQIEQARQAVDAAMNDTPFAPEGNPTQAINSMPMPMDGGDMQFGVQPPAPAPMPALNQELPQMANFGQPSVIAQEAMQQLPSQPMSAPQTQQFPQPAPQPQQPMPSPQQPMQNPLYTQAPQPQQPAAITHQMTPEQQQFQQPQQYAQPQQAPQQMPPQMGMPPSGPPPMPPTAPPPMPPAA